MDSVVRRAGFFVGGLTAFLTAASIVLMLPAKGRPAYTPDSIYYLLASRAIAQGHGITLPNDALFNPHYVPYTMWPPLYPILLSSGLPPLWIQAGILGCIAGFAFCLFAQLAKVPVVMALFMALAMLLPWPVLMDASYVWSELFALFWIFLSLFALSYLGQNGHTSRHMIIPWMLAAVAVSCAIYTRYASIIFIPGLMLALWRAPASWNSRWKLIIATPVVVGLLIAPLLLRNVIDSGSLSGAVRTHSAMDAGNVVMTITSYIGWVFAAEARVRGVFVVTLLALLFSVVIYLVDRQRLPQKTHGAKAHGPTWLAWMATSYAITYVIGIGCLRLWRHFDLSVRMVSLSSPLILLSLMACAVVVWRSVPVAWQRVVIVSPFAVLVFLSSLTSWQMGGQAWRDWRRLGSPEWHMSFVSVYSDLKPIKFPTLSGIVLNSRPRLMAFRSGWDFRRIPRHAESHQTLLRISDNATALLISSYEGQRLAKALRPIVPHPRFYRVNGALLLIWGKPQRAMGE